MILDINASTSGLVYVFHINAGSSSSIASTSGLLYKLGISRFQKNSTDLSNELKIAIGWEPSTMFCRKVIPDVPAYNSK